jgi:hypothetical protein
MNTVFLLLKSRFLLYPFYCPLTPPFPFSHYLYKYNIFLIKRLVRAKFPSVIIFINITLLLLLLQSPHGARASTAISQMRPNI